MGVSKKLNDGCDFSQNCMRVLITTRAIQYDTEHGGEKMAKYSRNHLRHSKTQQTESYEANATPEEVEHRVEELQSLFTVNPFGPENLTKV